MNIMYGNKIYYDWCEFGDLGYNQFRYNNGSYIGLIVDNSDNYPLRKEKCYWQLAGIRFPDLPLLNNLIAKNYNGFIDIDHVLYDEIEEAKKIIDSYLIRLNKLQGFK